MKPASLKKQLECDDGIFNINWQEEHPDLWPRGCEWRVLGGGGDKDGKQGIYWCTECGMVVCEKHRKGHMDSAQHRIRMETQVS